VVLDEEKPGTGIFQIEGKNVKLSLLTKHYVMKTYGGVDV
jgi:hypothetical protein